MDVKLSLSLSDMSHAAQDPPGTVPDHMGLVCLVTWGCQYDRLVQTWHGQARFAVGDQSRFQRIQHGRLDRVSP